MAAVLACGAGAVLSHQSAGELWGIRRRARRPPEAVRPGEPGAAHVTVPITRGKRARDGIVIHRSSTLTDSDCTRRDGIPVTKAARTLADLQAVLSPPELAAARREAEFLRLPIGEPPSVDRARTDLEAVFLSLCRRHRLPMPAVNAGVDRYEVDFLWPNVQLIVEVDGWESHRTRSAFEEDRARDAPGRPRLRGGAVHVAANQGRPRRGRQNDPLATSGAFLGRLSTSFRSAAIGRQDLAGRSVGALLTRGHGRAL